MNILIVEDNPINAKLLQHTLTAGGYATLWAANGRQALEYLDADDTIRLVISDIMMPEMDGLEFLARLRERPEFKSLPVIMCTSLSDLETVKTAAREGCRFYLVKPIQADQLLRKVRAILGREKAVLEDRANLMAELGLNAKAYDDILAAFADLVADTVTLLDQRVSRNDFGGHDLDLQNLTERAELLGAERVGQRLNDLADAKSGGSLKTINAAYSQLLRELKQLQHHLQIR